mgnify:CR=1 FL=1
MNELVKISNDGQMVVSSKDIAEHFEKEHKNVIQSVENLVAENSAAKSMFFKATFDNRGKQYPMYLMNRDGFSLLVMGFTGKSALEWKIKYIEAFNQMEAELKKKQLAIPADYPAALRALADAEEARLALLAENEQQRQAIADFEPIKHYVDTILESPSTLTTTQIAADYDLSAQRLNKILKSAGIQHNVNGQWILYKKHMGQGYTKSKTIQFTHSDGRVDSKMQTQWSQKGRLLIHEILTARGILAVMDKAIQAEMEAAV